MILDKKEQQQLELLKKQALQTGFPFENDVERILAGVKHRGTWSLRRNYKFAATADEQVKYRSVDFVLTLEYKITDPRMQWAENCNFARIHFIVEAKYLNAERWWLTPNAWPMFGSVSMPLYLPAAEINFEEGRANALKRVALEASHWPLAESGRKLLSSRKGEVQERDSLTSYFVQLSQGAASFAESRASSLLADGTRSSAIFRTMELFVPVLTSNLPISLLQENLTTHDIEHAVHIEELASEHDYVVLKSPPLKELWEFIAEKLSSSTQGQENHFAWNSEMDRGFPVILATEIGLPKLLQRYVDTFERAIGL